MALDTQTTPAMRMDSLFKSYGAVEVLHDINVEIGAGEFLVLVGPSGCGKSTLLNCIAGLETISGGALFIDGRNVTEEPPKDRDIAMVFQSYALYPTMSVAENIGFGMKIRKVPMQQRKAKINEVARLLQIEHLLDRKPSQLSGGQRQRVAMGRALVRNPALFLFDEPLSNLDAKLRVEMRAEIKRLHRNTNATIVYVTHDQVEAMTLASRIIVLKDGRVQQIGSPEEIYDRPANTFVADFMGSPPMNLIPSTLKDGRIQLGDKLLDVDAEHLPQVDGGITLGIRPEHFSLAEGQADLTVVPTMIENTGAQSYVTFELSGMPVVASLPGRMSETRTAPVGLNFSLRAITAFDPETGDRIT